MNARVVNLVQPVVETLLKVIGHPESIFYRAAACLKYNHGLWVFCANSLSNLGGEGCRVCRGGDKVKPLVVAVVAAVVVGDVFVG